MVQSVDERHDLVLCSALELLQTSAPGFSEVLGARSHKSRDQAPRFNFNVTRGLFYTGRRTGWSARLVGLR